MIKLGIIGSGFGLYGLLPAFNAISNCEVVAISGSKSERLLNYCKEIGLKKIYTDWQEMMEKEDLDAIAIAVIPSIQYQIAREAIKKGLHIFAEKPLAATLTQAKEMFTFAKQKKVVTAIDFIFPEIEEWKKVKQLIDSKKFGELKQFLINWDFLSYDIKNKKASWKTDIRFGGGALSFYFSHTLYYLEYFAGEISKLNSTLYYSNKSLNGGDVGVDLSLKFKSGAEGSAHLNCNNKILNRHQLIFQFEKGEIILENQSTSVTNFVITIKNGRFEKISLLKEKINKGEDERVRIVRKIATRFINSCIQKKQFKPSFNEGLRVQSLIEKIRGQQV